MNEHFSALSLLLCLNKPGDILGERNWREDE